MQEMESKPYRELVGSLIYLANATRPNLAFTASVLNRFCSRLGIAHWKLAKRVLRYIKGSMDYGLNYVKDSDKMHAYVDADWGSDIDRRSYTESVIILAKGPISWHDFQKSRRKPSTWKNYYSTWNLQTVDKCTTILWQPKCNTLK